jgi:hypothetical protein
MKTLVTITDRIAKAQADAATHLMRVTRVSLGVKEMECLTEWCDKKTYYAIKMSDRVYTMGVEIIPVDKASFFGYEIEEDPNAGGPSVLR